jgi:hypothetical protein
MRAPCQTKQLARRRGRPLLWNVGTAQAFGRYLGGRYATANVIWILGGDPSIESEDAGRGADWLLILESEAAAFPLPQARATR